MLDDVTERFLTNCDAEIAISADHGNGMGEWGVWAHPPGAIAPVVRKVPWITIAGKDSQTIDARTMVETQKTTESTVEERLAHLGYKRNLGTKRIH